MIIVYQIQVIQDSMLNEALSNLINYCRLIVVVLKSKSILMSQ